MYSVLICFMQYEMKIWCGIYFGGLENYENPPNQIPPFLFYCPTILYVAINSYFVYICQYKICQSLMKLIHQIKFLPNICLVWYIVVQKPINVHVLLRTTIDVCFILLSMILQLVYYKFRR